MQKITKQKKVDYDVFVAHDGTEFSADTLGSVDDAKAQCEKYEQSAEGIMASKAMKVLKPYIIPDSDKLSIDNVPESIRNGMRKWRKRLFNPVELAIKCIASELLTAAWSCLEDTATRVYTFKPKKQSDIDIVVQYFEFIEAPVDDWSYKEVDYGKDLAAVLTHYSTECAGVNDIKVGHMYIVIPVPDNSVTSVIDIEKVISLWTDLLNDVKENY